MRGRPKKKCISIAHYETYLSSYNGKEINQLDCDELLQNSIKTVQSYENNWAPYNLLFQVFDTNDLIFEKHIQTAETLRSSIFDVLDTLTPREEKVLDHLYGFTDGVPHSIFKVADDFELTTERIGQIRDKAIRKLKHPSRKEKLTRLLSVSNDFSSVLCGYAQRKLYKAHIEKLCKEANQRFEVYLNITDSVEAACKNVLFKTYSKELVREYLDTQREKLSWFDRMYTIQNDYIGTYIKKLTTWPSIGRALYSIGTVAVGEIYDLYYSGELVDILVNTGLVQKARAEHFAEQCRLCFLELGLIQGVGKLYNRDFISNAIEDMENLCALGKTSIVSACIPEDFLELFLLLNYRSIEDLFSDYHYGKLKARCEQKQTKKILGDVYDAISAFIESFEVKPIEYTVVSLQDYETIPQETQVAINELEILYKRKMMHQEENFPFQTTDIFDEEDFPPSIEEDFAFSICDDIEYSQEIDEMEDAYIVDLSLPLWVKLELERAGFVHLTELLANNFSDLLDKHKVGILAAEKLCTALDEQDFRLRDCSKENYPHIADYLHLVTKEIFEQFLKEEARDLMVTRLEVQAILDENGSMLYGTEYFYSKGETYSIGDYVVVPIKDGSKIGIGIVIEMNHLAPKKLPESFENLDHIIEKAEKEAYRARLQKYQDRLAELEMRNIQQKKEALDKNKVAVMTRKQLYDEVWDMSMAGVARKYGISYSKCVKQIKEAGIPTPSSGYWTLLGMGNPVEKTPLDEPFDEVVILVK